MGNTQQNLALPASKKGGGPWGRKCQGGCVPRPELASIGAEADIGTQRASCTPQCGLGCPGAWPAKQGGVGVRGVGAGPRAWESWSPTLPLPPGAPRESRPRRPSDAGLTKGNVLTGAFPAQTVVVLISRTTARGTGTRSYGLAKGVRLRQWRGNEIQGAFPPLNNADRPSDQGRGATGSQRGRGGGEQGTNGWDRGHSPAAGRLPPASVSSSVKWEE